MTEKNKTKNDDSFEENELASLIHAKIERLRPKLLDLTRRNPLLSTKFSDRSHSHIRIVDELPQVLFENMSMGSMKLIPLPPLEEDPKDEKTQEFQNALCDARLTEEIYINKLESIDQDLEDSADQLAVAERELKDRMREKFGLHPRQTKHNITLVHHAKNHHIRPQYELPLPSEVHLDGRHEDDLIQTLLLPDLFERRLNSLLNKCKTWMQETGIHVLKSAYGFLEWKESPTSDSSLAPLILLPVEIEKKKTRSGYEYSVFGQGERAETNTVLVEKMKHDFGLEFPIFDSEKMTVEEYFNEVIGLELQGKQLIVRRQVAIGVFPSARMAMYYDLDTTTWEFAEHEVVNELLGGSDENTTDTPFGEEYKVDEPKIEAKVPNLVMDADSSQFSTIVDVMDEKNMAVEGPPGTGKSQTIVNTIAAAISTGKKVLFVAEKMAALEVVRSRLEACGVGEFLLTLQANRASKGKVIQSIRDRIPLTNEREPHELEEKINRFRRTRSELQRYINIMSTKFAETSFSVHDILGWVILSQDKLSKHSQNLLECEVANLKTMTKEVLNEIIDVSNQFETAFKRNLTFKQHWSFIKRANIDPYSADEILKLAQDASKSCNDSNLLRAKLTFMELNKDLDCEELEKLRNNLDEIGKCSETIDIELVKKFSNERALKKVNMFFIDKEDTWLVYERFKSIYSNPLEDLLPEKLENLSKIVSEMGLKNLDINSAEKICEKNNSEFLVMQEEIEIISEAGKVNAFLLNKTIQAVVTACDIGANSERTVLAMRKKTLEPAPVKAIIMKSSETCNTLRKKKEDIEKDYYLESFDKDEIDGNCEIFKKSGLFAIFSSKYRVAKRSYLSMSKDKKFKKANAIPQSKMISKWIEEVNCFNELKELLEDSFNGLETNFKLLEDLMDYYDQIDTKLRGIENKEVREFLRRGDVDSILALPKIDTDHAIRNSNCLSYNDLSAKANQVKENSEKFKYYIQDLEGLVSVFVDHKEIDVNLLPEAGNELREFQERWRSLNDNTEMSSLLGDYFKGIETDRQEIQTSIDMATIISILGDELGNAMMLIFKDGRINESIVDLEAIINNDIKIKEEISRLARLLNIKSEEILLSRSKHELSVFLKEAANNKEGLIAFSIVYANQLEFHSRGLGSIIDELLLSEGNIDGLSDIVVAVIGQLLAREVYKEYGNVLASYDGSKLNHLRQKFAILDKEIIDLTRKKLKGLLMKNSHPPNGIGKGKKSEWTDMSLLRNEIEKKTRHISARDLTKRAGSALLEIKPCWMMSPLAVAQYIDKDDIEFDLIIIDEASQMTPEDAIGALARGKHAMVVGDTNQLPPSSFFKKYFDVMNEEEDEVVSEESILEMANAIFRPARRLKWHYRSKHPGLIAFSNKYVYNSDLIVFPSPGLDNKMQGVSFKSVNGLYKSGTNPIESTEIVKAAIEFMHKNKDMSLGIVVLNLKQKDLLLEEMEYAISNDSIATDYIEHWEVYNDGLESFFVKNLENVQGDERDVIFIGTVYGPEKVGAPVMQRFGPINGITGKRRLNVLFSRAKHKIITFSSMNANDIRVSEGGNEGVELLKNWLEYSALGKLLEVESAGREPGSEFEAYVIEQLKAIGCQTIPQVGVTGYFIDIGVKHPDWPHGFIMGVECDGATYHSTKSARDRDRLRQEVLKGLGWYLHRIWSTDWFNDPLSETKRLREVIECRLKELKNCQEGTSPIDNSTKNSSFTGEPPSSTAKVNAEEDRNYVTDLHKEIDIFIKDGGNVTVLDIANSFYLKPSHVKVILNQLIKSGFICKDDFEDKVYYSTNPS